MSAAPSSFRDSYFGLTGHPEPMAWQQRLFDLFVKGEIPAALDLPTGLGKTSVMAIWLAARTLAGDDALKAIPRRLVYIVDRRAVVDQATEEAEKLRDALNCDDKPESKAEHLKGLPADKKERAFSVLRALRKSLGIDGPNLPISTLRGAYVDNREWLDNPAAPAIIVGTVDMIGSRLLFEGYGVSRKMRPYHAGLLGTDTLIVLDEAHLVPPFEALLWRIADAEQFGSCAESDAKLVPPFKLLPLSATGRAQPASDSGAATSAFRLEDEDLSDPIVKDRLSAKKTVGFVDIDGDKSALAEELAHQAWKLAEEGGKPTRSLIYCDSREVAEKVKAGLDKLSAPDKKRDDPKADTELFVGARRVKEREDAKAWLEKHGFLAGSPPPAKPAFLIATSAGEVGIDLDADHMVCDLVPWERMVQRLGRVNRRGQDDATIIVVYGDGPKPMKPDAPTDQELRQAISFRSLSVLNELPNVETGRDASPGALRELKLRAETDKALRKKIDEATTPEPLHPALTRALVDAWSMTSLEQHTGRPDVAPWLRGWEKEDDDKFQTSVLWRRYLPIREGAFVSKKEIASFFEAAPPHSSELLETESWRVIEWLVARAKETLKFVKASRQADQSDDGDRHVPTWRDDPDLVRLQPLSVVAYALDHADDLLKSYRLNDLSEADSKMLKELGRELRDAILVVDRRLAGLKEGLLDPKEESAPRTADDGGRWSEAEGKPVVGFRVRVSIPSDDMDSDDWHESYRFEIARQEDEDVMRSIVIEGVNEERRSESRHPQLLADHQSWAENRARQIAHALGFDNMHAEVLSIAARLHDEGKRVDQWQRAFSALKDGVYAKTKGPLRPNWLNGYRHEFGSLAVFDPEHKWAKTLPAELQNRIESLRPTQWFDLLQHLIAAHHGGARPTISTDGCEDGPPSALQERAREVALRFARLQKRWGPWGLAWWEALLRAADQQASRDNDSGKGLGASRQERK